MKWIGLGVGGLVGAIVLLVVVLYVIGGSRLSETYDIEVRPVAIPAEAGVPEDGWPIAVVAFCQECHGDNLAGDVLSDDPMFGKIVPPNLTSGRGGIGGTYTDIDWIRSVRHGVGPKGKPLFLMPSHEFYKFSDADLGEVIAYLKSVPPVDNEVAETSVGPLGKIIALLEGELLPASVIDHTGPRPAEPVPGVTAEFGKYMTWVCSVCHGADLSGGTLPGEEADAPLAPNLTPRGNLSDWSEQDFIRTLRTGTTPYGKALDNEFMPWEDLGLLTDDQLKAIWLYLSSLPALETTQ